ncbi:hypothetical protein AQUCO_02000174v1 [Aquilegia coerulea]|uniref:Uncharacterized protein n=1 Tax=Aquilegia coerulea TaxID=218851 RepID=A0A2G5DG85_AQUCA|nr:hypothetical protein AQUCO_02000174v1 [Aquilegia coerulea]
MDISGVQKCTSNLGKIVYLIEGPHRSNRRGFAGTCEICYRSLHNSFRFCSLGCKVSLLTNCIQLFAHWSTYLCYIKALLTKPKTQMT